MIAPDPRAELIADLRAFADLLERRPDMPIGEFDTVTVQYSVYKGDEAVRIAEVERVANILGVDVQRDARLVTARLELGRVAYQAATGTDFGDAAFDADYSYHGAVEPDLVSR